MRPAQTEIPEPAPLHLVAAAQTFLGFGVESEHHRGSFVDALLVEAEGRAPVDSAEQRRWDSAFVHHVGYWSQFRQRDERTAWPLPYHADLDATAKWARAHALVRHAASAGDVFLLWSAAEERYVRIGIVAEVTEATEIEHGLWQYDCITIEGDSSYNLELGGGRVTRHKRQLAAHRRDLFIDWTAALLDKEVL
jgi:hypothetical protein